jgi:uncharacterized phage-associated protein
MTHLKLQKLVFYSWGIGASLGHESDLGPVVFEPWEHGPVSREVWNQYRAYRRAPIPAGTEAAITYQPETSRCLEDVLEVYGGLTAWNIRQQTHLERPWADAYRDKLREIPRNAIVEHFQGCYGKQRVMLPEYVLDSGSLWLDGIQPPVYRSLSEAATAVSRARRGHAPV